MSTFTEQLKERLDDAQLRMQRTQMRLQQAQAEHQAVMQEVGSLQTLLNIENQKEQIEQQRRMLQQAQPKVSVPPAAVVHPAIAVPQIATHTPRSPAQLVSSPSGGGAEVNKTEIIREVLRQNPTGITPAQVWTKVHEHVGRAYVYSVLKRMKDKKQVIEKRGKYYLQEKAQEEKDSSIVQ